MALTFAVVGAGIVLQVTGDVQVADSIWRTSSNPETGAGYERGHDNAELGDLIVLVGGLVFGLTSEAGLRRRPGAALPGPPAPAQAIEFVGPLPDEA